MQIQYKASAIHFDEEAILNAIAGKAEKHLAELGEHVAAVASARAPVGSDTPTSARSFQPVKLRNVSEFPAGRSGAPQRQRHERFAELEALGGGGRKRLLKKAGGTHRGGLLQFFRGTRAHGTVKQSPTQLKVQGNTIVGAFQHEPGRLKKSIRFVGVERDGNRVVATVRAHVPYAMAVHDGFTHKGGSKHQGKATRIKGQPFLKNALVNIQGRLTEASAYEG